MPKRLAALTHELYTNLIRRIKRVKSLSAEFSVANGYGQGEVMTLVPALLLVSMQFYVVEAQLPKVRKGASMDDRNYRGTLGELTQVDKIIHAFDKAAGHTTQAKKIAFAATLDTDRLRLEKMTLQRRND